VGERSSVEDVDSAVILCAIPADDSGDAESLTLFRTPQYEFALDEPEPSVEVSFEDLPHSGSQLSGKLTIAGDMMFKHDGDKETQMLLSAIADPDERDNKPNGYRCSSDACSLEIGISCPQAKSLVFFPSELL
jgi:hypothetical protein